MKVTQSSGISGKWVDKKMLKTGDKVKLKTEATDQPSQQGGMQLVAKLLVQGQIDALNVAINKPSKNALIQAFGDDTLAWVDKSLTAHVETAIISGKRGVALYLVPEGFEVKEDSGGYLVVSRVDDYPKEDINVEDIPF